jgi:hypothetical protein
MAQKRSQLDALWRQHSEAIRSYDFERANLINKQIELLHESAPSIDSELSVELQKQKIRDHLDQADTILTKTRHEIEAIYIGRCQDLDEIHTQQYRELCLRHTQDLERETARPVPEANSLLLYSRLLGKQHKYELAAAVFQEAQSVRKATLADRCSNADALFERSQRKLREKQEREKDILRQRESQAFAALDSTYKGVQDVLANRLKVKDLKERWTAGRAIPPDERPAPVTRRRRSRSVSRGTSLPERSWQNRSAIE